MTQSFVKIYIAINIKRIVFGSVAHTHFYGTIEIPQMSLKAQHFFMFEASHHGKKNHPKEKQEQTEYSRVMVLASLKA